MRDPLSSSAFSACGDSPDRVPIRARGRIGELNPLQYPVTQPLSPHAGAGRVQP